jgi:hypothetical protein
LNVAEQFRKKISKRHTSKTLFFYFQRSNLSSTMRISLQRAVFTGLMAVGVLGASSTATAQKHHDYYWGNPDIPYIEQRGFSLGANFGVADMWGDVGTKSAIDRYKYDYFDNIRFMGGMFVRYSHVPGLAFRLGVNYGSLYATDAANKEKAMQALTTEDDYFQRYVRNLDASTNIWEGNFMVEISPLRLFSDWEFGRPAKWRFQPYIMLGITGFHFNPRGTNKNLTAGTEGLVDLRPLHTEGQNYTYAGAPQPYQTWSYAALGGVGVRVELGQGLALGLEYQLRHTFTDYLDDVSGTYIDPLYHDIAYLNEFGKSDLSKKMMDRGNEVIPGYKHAAGQFRGDPDNKDMFSTVSIMFFWRINKRDSPWWSTF